MLYPFWREFIPTEKYPWSRLYGKYLEISNSLFKMTSLQEADLVVMPINWRMIRGESWKSKVNKEVESLSIEFAEKVANSGKELIIFFAGDCCAEEIPVKNATVMRMAVYRSKRKQKDIIMPSFTEDFVEEYLGG
jgi:hypothetical protein